MVGSWLVVAVALYVTRDPHSRCIYLHQGQLKRDRKMRAMMMTKIELLLSREAIHRNRRIQNVARQGALIQTDTDSQCHIDK
ncbi:hypothetical protein KUCAC02_015347 [Chaenocephalus aceratus]|uniref:Uncharacterized protein n=1 Tax=Chaenocephalus aceratus TaxID=36190 RepID=A0ACB9XYJ6_CHAAC|nr:hypothetical protein KUCAC02_015347 [Chaenocephalus aceratus]